jgi:Kef-type K+ transport system membrane component KefB/voltage-gated potassium channel Kch
MSHIFYELTVVLVLATALGYLARLLKQPTILGYIVTGIVVGPLGMLRLDNVEILDAMAQIGIATLLFLVGMEMRVADLRDVGKPAILTGIGQIVFTSIGGYALVRLLGFAPLPALYIAVALTFSSTIIVVKLLSEKNALDSLYGRIVVGFLLVQDFVALGFLVLLSSLNAAGPVALSDVPLEAIGLAFAKGTALLAATVLIGRTAMPAMLKSVARSPELVFLVSIAWGMGLAAFAASGAMGLSIEFGAFLAGVSMAETFERLQVSSRIKSLRDFFIVLFFVVLGSKMAFGDLAAVAWPTLVLSLFVLVGNPLIVLLVMGGLGYRSKTSFLASVTVAQISEFSLIIMALGHRLGHFGQDAVTLITAVGIVTIAISSYLILYAERLYDVLRRSLAVFEFRRPNAATEPPPERRKGHIVLVGCHRVGHNILRALETMHKDFVVVDISPDVIDDLLRHGIDAVYGDIGDPDIQEAASLSRARLVISTVPDRQDSLHLVHAAKRANPRTKVIITAETEHEAKLFYDEGADYVLIPHFMSGMHLADVIEHDKGLRSLARMRAADQAIIDGRY